MNRSGNSAMHVPLHRYCYYASARATVKIIIANDPRSARARSRYRSPSGEKLVNRDERGSRKCIRR